MLVSPGSSNNTNVVELAVKGQRFLKLTHSIVSIESVDFSSRSLELFCEYHIKLSSAKPGDQSPSQSGGGSKALGLGFVLPDGKQVHVSGVKVNGNSVKPLSIHNDLENISFFDLSYWCFPESADSDALGKIFSRLCENRRDLISYEEISKAHAAASTGQSFGLLLKIPPSSDWTDSLTVSFRIQVTQSLLFKQLNQTQGGTNDMCLASIGNEIWFPVPSRLMVLPSGVSVTANPMEHHRHKCTVKVKANAFPEDLHVVVSGDFVQGQFESSWINLRSVGLFAGNFTRFQDEGVFKAYSIPENEALMAFTLKRDIVTEIIQVLAPWFASPASPLPQLNLVFLPLPVGKSFNVYGNTLLIDSSILHREGFLEKQIIARPFLAEAIASLWVERCMPVFAEPWIAIGIATMLADRFVEFHLGLNEYTYRVINRRQRYHAMVERGLDWKPLPVIFESTDPLLKFKAPLVMDCLRRSIVGDADMRVALHELATVASGKKGPWTSESLFYLFTCIVGQHTEAGQSIPRFKQDWVQSVGVPVIHVGFSMLEKRRFALNVSQRPLQRIYISDNSSTSSFPAPHQHKGTASAGGCACGIDLVSRKDEPHGGASYMRSHQQWPATTRRRFWNGDIQVSIFRATNFYVPVSVKMEDTSPDLAQQVLTVPYVTPRKHEQVLNRATRDDELVHGWITVVDDKWLLAKTIVCQSSLMWCNQLRFSRNVSMEHAALDALQHIRGSALGQEALVSFLHGLHEVFWRIREEAGKALIHLAIGCAEREAIQSVVAWLESTILNSQEDLHKVDPSEWLTWFGVAEQLALARRSADRRDQKSISDVFALAVKVIEKARVIAPCKSHWRMDPDLILSKAIRFTLLSISSAEPSQCTAFASIDTRIRSDMYGSPLSSVDLLVTEAVVSSAPSKVSPSWSFLKDPKWIENLCLNPNRRVSRTAVRAYFAQLGACMQGVSPESETAWILRFAWIEKLTQQIVSGKPEQHRLCSLQVLGWLIDCWETVVERYRRDSSKSAFVQTLQKREMCLRIWKYLTTDCMQLPSSARAHVQALVHSLYIQAYGTGVPTCFREEIEGGPLRFWLPFKEHERIYKRFLLRGATVRPEKKIEIPKKPRLLITSAGIVPLNDPFSKPSSSTTISQNISTL